MADTDSNTSQNSQHIATGAGFPATLLAGYDQFKTGRLDQDRERYQQLAETGQKPEVMIISCCDSRATPEAIFSAAPGDLFIVRNVANIVPPHNTDGDNHGVSSALEFAVQALGIKHIVVMGHGRCGGIAAFRQKITGDEMAPLSEGNFIAKWIKQLDPVEHRLERKSGESAEELQRKIEEQNIAQSVDNLRTFPFISTLLDGGKLDVHGAWFDIATGELWTMNESTGIFEQPFG